MIRPADHDQGNARAASGDSLCGGMEDQLRQHLSYDPLTGTFRWRATGQKAGSLVKGYVKIQFKRKAYVAHRLAWLFVHGEWPKQCIDHANGDPADNRFVNLRDASIAENCRNRRPYERALPKGVSLRRGDKYVAQIMRDGKNYFLGSFGSPEAAHAAYVVAAGRLHGEFARAE